MKNSNNWEWIDARSFSAAHEPTSRSKYITINGSCHSSSEIAEHSLKVTNVSVEDVIAVMVLALMLSDDEAELPEDPSWEYPFYHISIDANGVRRWASWVSDEAFGWIESYFSIASWLRRDVMAAQAFRAYEAPGKKAQRKTEVEALQEVWRELKGIRRGYSCSIRGRYAPKKPVAVRSPRPSRAKKSKKSA
jgi:hypothetical protein